MIHNFAKTYGLSDSVMTLDELCGGDDVRGTGEGEKQFHLKGKRGGGGYRGQRSWRRAGKVWGTGEGGPVTLRGGGRGKGWAGGSRGKGGLLLLLLVISREGGCS